MGVTIQCMVEGGKATPGPPIGPALGPLGVNAKAVVDEINNKTKNFAGMKVPVKIAVDPVTKSFDIEIGTPPTSALIMKELGVEKGAKGEAGVKGKEKIGNLSFDQVAKVANMKVGSILARNFKDAVKEVLGTCLSMGVTCEGKSPREIIKEINEGKWDSKMK